jgi:hypothetical protein
MTTSIYIGADDEVITDVKSIGTVESKDFLGIEIVTNKQSMTFLISDERLCCESFGVGLTQKEQFNINDFMSVEEVNSLIGSTLLKVSYGSEEKLKSSWDCDEYGNVIKVNIKTSSTDFIVCIYNIHNGYYSHNYKIKYGDHEDFNDHI